MSTITKEWLQKAINDYESVRDELPFGLDDYQGNILAALRIALASLEAEPIGYMNRFTGRVFTLEEQPGADTDAQVYVPFYTAPPAPVLPRDLEEIIFSIVNAMADEKLRDDESELFSLAKKYIEHAKSKLGAAMLQGSEPVTTTNKLPEETGSSLQLRNLIRQRHAEWSQATFGDVGPVGPLKHLSKEALEAAEEPDDLSEWADMQFLLWDAQRRAGISDGEITAAMEEKLKVNMARQWPEPKDGEPRLHIKAAPHQEAK